MEAVLRTPQDRLALERGYTYDSTQAHTVKAWIEKNCIQSKYPHAHEPLRLMAWQWESLILPAYSWYRPKPGITGEPIYRYDTVMAFLGRRQGKSALIAACGLYELSSTLGGEVVVVAATVSQATHLYEYIADYIELGPLGQILLEDDKPRYWIRRHIRTIEDRATRSTLVVLSSDPSGAAGRNITTLILDEITSWPDAYARLVYDRLMGSFANRPNHRTFIISSAQYNLQHLGYDLFRRAQEIQSGERIEELHTLAVVYSLPATLDWRDPENWWSVLPSLRENDPNGVVEKQFYLDEYTKCRGNSADETRFRTDYLTQFCGTSSQWIDLGTFAKCKAKFTEEDLLDNQGVCSGLDLAMRGDLCGYVVIVKKDDLYHVLPRALTPKQLAKQREKSDHVPITQWAEDRSNNLHLTDGDVIDPTYLQKLILKDQETFGPHPVRYDPWGAELFRQQMESVGVEMIEVSQVPGSMAPPTAWFERLIRDERIRINHNPVYDWCLGNCVPRIDSHSRITIDKRKSTQRVDLIIATVIGLTEWMGDEGDTWQGSMCGIF